MRILTEFLAVDPRQDLTLMTKRQQSQNLLLKVHPRSTFRKLFLNPQQMFLLRDKLITQGEKRDKSNQNLQ